MTLEACWRGEALERCEGVRPSVEGLALFLCDMIPEKLPQLPHPSSP